MQKNNIPICITSTKQNLKSEGIKKTFNKTKPNNLKRHKWLQTLGGTLTEDSQNGHFYYWLIWP